MSGDDKPKKKILSSADDVRIAAGLLVMDEVDNLLDRFEKLDLANNIGSLETLLDSKLSAISSKLDDDPLSLSLPRQSDSVQDEGYSNVLICCMIAGLLGVIVGCLGTYFLLKG